MKNFEFEKGVGIHARAHTARIHTAHTHTHTQHTHTCTAITYIANYMHILYIAITLYFVSL